MVSCRRRKVAGFEGYAFVANSAGQAVAVVDLGAFATIRHIRLDAHPVQVLSHPSLPAVYAVTPASGGVHRIDTDTLQLDGSVHCAAASVEMAPGGESMWALTRDAQRLIPIDAPTLETSDEVRLPFAAAAWNLSPDGRFAALVSGASGEIAAVDLESRKPVFQQAVGGSADMALYRSDGRQVLVANRRRRALTILDAATGGVVVELPLALEPDDFCLKPDGGELYVTGKGLDAVVTVHPYQTQIAATTVAGRAPGPMAASADPDYLFVTNPTAGDLSVINLRTRRVIAVVSVGTYPHYVALTPDSRFALVLNRDSGDMAVVRVESLSGRRRKFAPLFTMVPVGSRPTKAVVRHV